MYGDGDEGSSSLSDATADMQLSATGFTQAVWPLSLAADATSGTKEWELLEGSLRRIEHDVGVVEGVEKFSIVDFEVLCAASRTREHRRCIVDVDVLCELRIGPSSSVVWTGPRDVLQQQERGRIAK